MNALATDLPIGHYAIGVLEDGEEIDIYRASPAILLNVATNQAVTVTTWRKPEKKKQTPSLPL